MENERIPAPILYDMDIREPLFEYLEERFGKSRMMEEKTIGRSRADVMMVTETGLIGLEIKSDADTYERLKRQVKDYDRYFDANYVVVGKSHEKHVEEHIPDHWGILTAAPVGRDILIEEKRPARPNPKRKPDLQLTLLWRQELQHILDQNHLPKYKQKSRRFVREKILDKLEWKLIKAAICAELFERDYTLWDEEPE